MLHSQKDDKQLISNKTAVRPGEYREKVSSSPFPLLNCGGVMWLIVLLNVFFLAKSDYLQ